jgi:hypothetical protein
MITLTKSFVCWCFLWVPNGTKEKDMMYWYMDCTKEMNRYCKKLDGQWVGKIKDE